MKITREEAAAWLEKWREKPSKKTTQILAEYPELTGKVQILWHSNYWDGPLTGYVTVEGDTGYWIETLEDRYNTRLDLDDPEDDSCQTCDCDTPCFVWDRLYAVYKMTPEQERIRLANHVLFQKHVGTHTDYGVEQVDYNDPDDPSPIRLAKGLLPGDTYHLFYDAVRPTPPPVEPHQLVGWTTDIHAKGLRR